MQLVGVETRGDVMRNLDRRVVHQSPAGAPKCEAERKLPMHLCPATSQALVEANGPNGVRAKTAAHALEDVYIARCSRSYMMVADHSAEPLHAAYITAFDGDA